MKNVAAFIALVSVCVALSGCLVPEKFSASVVVNQDATYIYKYKGTAVHAMAAAARKQGQLSANDEATFRDEFEKHGKNTGSGVQKIEYLGNGRYEILLEQTLKFGQKSEVIPLARVTQESNGVVTVASPEFLKKDLDGLASLKIQIDGKLEVALPKNAEVLSHNASGTPGFFSKTYSWKIGQVDQRPTIQFRINPTK